MFQKIEQEPETKSFLKRAMQKVADGFAVVKRHKWKIVAGLSLAAGFAIWYYWEYLLGLGIRFKDGWQNFVPGTEAERNAAALKNALEIYSQSNPSLQMIGVDHSIIFNGVTYSNMIPGQMESLKALLQQMKLKIPNAEIICTMEESIRGSTESILRTICTEIGTDLHTVNNY